MSPSRILAAVLLATLASVQPAAVAQEAFERTVIGPCGDQAPQNSYPCLARLADGRLLAVWVTTAPGRQEFGPIVGVFSGDHGRTWSAPKVLIAVTDERCCDPSIIVSGPRILVTATVMTGEGISTSYTTCTRSEDNGETWSKPYEIPMNHRYTAGKTHRGLRLKSGVLLMGYSWDIPCEEQKTLEAEHQMHLRTGMMISRDNGLTWTNGQDFDVDCKPITNYAILGSAEPAIVELDDGRVFMLVRTGSDRLYQAYSANEGNTWTDVGPSPLKGHNAPATLCRFQVGSRRGILCVWNHGIERYPLCAAASFDEGKTWSTPKDIAGPTDGQQAAYPSCEQAADGTLVAIWFQQHKVGNAYPRDIRCARFTLDWLLQDGSPQPPTLLGPAGPSQGDIGDSYLVANADGTVDMIVGHTTPTGAAVLRKRSQDKCRTWSEPEVLCPMSVGENYGTMPLLTREGDLQLFWMVRRGPGNTPAVDYFIDVFTGRFSKSSGTLSPPARIFEGYVGSINGMAQLPSGRIVLPFAFWLAGVPDGPPTGNNVVTVVYSDDNGHTWQQSPARLTVPCLPNYNGDNLGAVEPNILPLRDGRVWMLIRTQLGRFYESFSPDGATWSEPVASRFYSTDSPAGTLRLPDGRIVLFWNNCENTSRINGQGVYTNRDALHAAISRDEGKTWRGYREVYRDPFRNDPPPKLHDRGTAYPYPVVTPDGTILCISGQGEGRRRIFSLEPDWLEETHAADDFSNGLDAWSVFKAFGEPTGWWRDRVQGAVLVDHPTKPGAKALHIRRPDEKHGDGACWNFPSGRQGKLTVRLLLQPGCQGVSLALADRFIQPSDNLGEQHVLFSLPISAAGRLPDGTELAPNLWHTVVLSWNLDAERCEVSVDDRPAGHLTTSDAPSTGICYLRLRSTAAAPDTAGMLVESVKADVSN